MHMYDMAKMKKLKLLGEGAPDAWEGFKAFDKAAMADGVVPKKYKELIALAVALTTQCPYDPAGARRDGDGGGGTARGSGGDACHAYSGERDDAVGVQPATSSEQTQTHTPAGIRRACQARYQLFRRSRRVAVPIRRYGFPSREDASNDDLSWRMKRTMLELA
jgi:alkylhydroperoxidase/carboxymuconolactone decarboxylase family protein YurZ